MNSIIRLGLICLLLAVANPRSTSASDLKPLGPFLDPHTVAIAELNLDQLNVGIAADNILKRLPEPLEGWAAMIDQVRAVLEPWHQEFRQAGGQRVYLVLNLTWIGTQPPIVIVVPLTANADAERLRNALAIAYPAWKPRVLRGCVVTAPETVLDRLGRAVAPGNAERWQAAFDAAPPGLARLVLIPYPGSDRVMDSLLPVLPKMLGGGPGSILTRGFKRGTVSLDLPPADVLSLTIQSDSAESAVALRRVMDRAVTALGQMPDVQRQLPAWHQLRGLILPIARDDQLLGRLDFAQVVEVILGLQPPMEQARAKAQHVATINRLKQIGLSLRIHASDHGDRFPNHLADIVRTLGDPALLLRPGTPHTPPADLTTRPRDAQVAWVDEHSPFVYVLPGAAIKDIRSPQTTVVVYERFEPGDTSPVGVLFADGHVESLSPERLRALLDTGGM